MTTIIKKNKYASANMRFGIFATMPALIILLVLFVYPLAFSLAISFTDYTVANVLSGSKLEFTGIDNYIKLLKDTQFISAIKNTCIIAIFAISAEFLIGLLLSVSVSRIKRFRGLCVTIFMMTIMIAPVVVALLFKFLLGNELGVLNTLLKEWGFIKANIPWLTQSNLARASIIMIDTWQATSTIFLLIYTAIIGIPADVLESAKVDGSGSFATFWFIILPMVKNVIIYAMVIRLMDALRIFDSIYLVTNGGPAGSTESMALYIYRKSWTQLDISSASAASFILMAMLVVGIFVIRRLGAIGEETVR